MKIDDTLSRWSRRKASVIGNPRDFANAMAQLWYRLANSVIVVGGALGASGRRRGLPFRSMA
jgi:hypothetical protein